MSELFADQTEDEFECQPMTEEEQKLLLEALKNLNNFVDDNSPHYILVDKDPRNEDDYDTWDVGMEPIPGDTIWQST
jgi:hypothetical protein